MGMVTKGGKYYANPAVGRRMEGADEKRGPEKREMDEKPEMETEHMGSKPHSVHIMRVEDGEGGDRHHVVAHHPHGAEVSEHDSLDDAMNHAHSVMKGADDGDANDDGAPEFPTGSLEESM